MRKMGGGFPVIEESLCLEHIFMLVFSLKESVTHGGEAMGRRRSIKQILK